ncbi:MAG: hypothetical protein ACLQNE_40055 [Thermoguttaceae bacterium]
MNARPTRRQFLTKVGQGMLMAGVGCTAAVEMGLAPADAAEGPESLEFGPLEPLVALMQETPTNRLLPVLVERLRSGAELGALVAAAALANARTFGGEDYVGFHTMMALAPAYHMALELPESQRSLPVLKVLYRNNQRICASLRRTGSSGPAGVRIADAFRDQRRRRPARGKVLPHGVRGVCLDPQGVPLAAIVGIGPRYGQRVRPPGSRLRRSVQPAEAISRPGDWRDNYTARGKKWPMLEYRL